MTNAAKESAEVHPEFSQITPIRRGAPPRLSALPSEMVGVGILARNP
jgi:hypothetical protein